MEEKRESQSSEETQTVSEGRRNLLKVLAASGGAFVAATLLPGKWVKPVIDWGVLPLHAQVSPGVEVFFSSWTVAPAQGGEKMQTGSPAQGQALGTGFQGTAVFESSAGLSLGDTFLGLNLYPSGFWPYFDGGPGHTLLTLQQLIDAGILILGGTLKNGSMQVNFGAMLGDTSVDIGLYKNEAGMMSMNLISNILNAPLGSIM